MKRFYFMFLVSFFAVGVYAQTYNENEYEEVRPEKTRFGLKVGGVISGVNDIHPGSEKRFPGLAAGAMLQIPLQKKDVCHLYFTPELLYSQEGEKDDKLKVDFYQDYLTLPLLIKGYLTNSKLLYLEAGPRLGYMISQKEKDIDKQRFSEPNKFDVGLLAGAGLNFGKNNSFELGARLYYGLLDMYPDYKNRNNNLSIMGSLAYLFGGGERRQEVITQEIIDVNNEKINEIREEVRQESVKEKEPIIVDVTVPEFESVYFDLDKSIIKSSEAPKIDAAAKFLKEHLEYSVRIIGYADRKTGTPHYNMGISQRRVEAVQKYLIEKQNINATRIITAYEGDTIQPEAINEKNRCVTIYMLER